jgi:hypothetical protein
MPYDITRALKVAGVAAGVDYLLGNQILGLIPEGQMPADENMKSALRTGVCVAAADLLLQNISL